MFSGCEGESSKEDLSSKITKTTTQKITAGDKALKGDISFFDAKK